MAELQQAILQMAELLQKLAQPTPAPSNPEQILESLATNISEFSFDPENGITFEKWYSRYADLFDSDAKNLEDPAKVRLLLRKLDTPSHTRFVNYILPKLPKDVNFVDTIETLKKIFGTQTSIFNKRYQCMQLVKSEAEDIISYGGKVNRACEDFEFQNVKLDQFKCLIFVCGLKAHCYADIRARLLSRIENETTEAPVTLQSLIEDYQRLVNLKADTSMIERQSSSKPTVNAVHEQKGISHQQQFSKTESKLPRTPCWQCGQMHYVRDCSFSNHQCKQCHRVGHKEGYCGCFSKTFKPLRKGEEKVSYKSNKSNKSKKVQSRKIVMVNHIAQHSSKRKFVPTFINGVRTRLQLDTASDITVISKNTWKFIGRPAIKTPTIEAINASGKPLHLIGEFLCDVSINGKSAQGRCFVTTASNLNLLGIDWIETFGLWSIPRNSVCNQVEAKSLNDKVREFRAKHADVFNDSLGHCKKMKVKLFLKSNAQPVFCPKRPVPFNTIPLIDCEITRLQSLGIIEPIDFSEWAAPIVAVRKPNGRVRICADYSTGLNAVLEANHYPLPTPEEIFAQLNGSSIFSIIDLSDAYLQLEVDDDSKKLLTINTHRGLFRFNRLAPGVKSAPGAFQRLVDGMIAGIPGVRSFIDDVIVFGRDMESHTATLNQLFKRLKEYGFHVKAEKCSFFQPQIRYLGHIVNSQGIRPDPEKIQAITTMPPPTNIAELRSFLGAVNFYGRFVRNLHELRHPMDRLLKKEMEWQWTVECQQAFEKFKTVLQSNLLLTHYDPNLPIIVAADASNTGIGAVIFHKYPDGRMKAVQHASRTLATAERNYGQPEKEGLALVFAVTKFHKYLLGRRFTLLTDHKPLLSIFGSKKGIPLHTANRLQRWALTMLNYDFEIAHVSTSDFGCADLLSRLIDQTNPPEEEFVIAALTMEEDLISILADTTSNVPVSFAALQKATATNSILQSVVKYICDGWPNESLSDAAVQPYYNRRESLSLIDGCVMFGNRVVVPNMFRQRILKQFHRGHPGIVRMKAIARSFVYWPGIDNEIEEFVKRCPQCCIAGKTPIKTTLESWPVPSKPWSRIHIDYAGPIDGVYFFVLVDPYSKWPEVYMTKSTTAKSTIKLLYQSFATFGVPETIVSDNGSQFSGHEFQAFCTNHGIRHIRIAPYHPQSNGLAERFVDTLKRSFRKIRSGGVETLEEALHTFLQVYRSTPTSDLERKSPAEMMFGRPMGTILSLLQPNKPNNNISRDRNNQKEAFNRKHGAIKRNFKHGDSVYAKIHQANSWHWEPATIIEKVGNVTYNVFLGDQHRLIRSHANQLKSRVDETSPLTHLTPLTVFFDEFGLSVPEENPVAVIPPLESPEEQHLEDQLSNGTEDFSDPELDAESGSSDDPESAAATEPEQPATPLLERGRRIIQLPARFKPYWMTKP